MAFSLFQASFLILNPRIVSLDMLVCRIRSNPEQLDHLVLHVKADDVEAVLCEISASYHVAHVEPVELVCSACRLMNRVRHIAPGLLIDVQNLVLHPLILATIQPVTSAVVRVTVQAAYDCRVRRHFAKVHINNHIRIVRAVESVPKCCSGCTESLRFSGAVITNSEFCVTAFPLARILLSASIKTQFGMLSPTEHIWSM